jgi:hypothetical protein
MAPERRSRSRHRELLQAAEDLAEDSADVRRLALHLLLRRLCLLSEDIIDLRMDVPRRP